MAARFPQSMDECVYFTNRKDGKGKAVAWVFRELCPKCGKALMGKPVEKGKVKVRALEYVCPVCGHAVPKDAYEDTLTVNVQYTCKSCGTSGEVSQPYKRKTFQGVKAIVFECTGCHVKIPITKKMKDPKKKGDVDAEEL
ncbi:MAG: hypothetical protein HC945_02200 [Nitrosarchaeum sp.]|nr:hypothetical protein [Nitrosarchaeum sp.]